VTAWIDGRPLTPRGGERVLEAARRLSIDLPALCSVPGLEPLGSCRLCLVEVEGRGDLQAACHLPLADGMRISTETPRLVEMRRGLLRLLMEESGARLAADPEGPPLSRWLARHGVSVAGATADSRADRSHPYLLYDPGRCVACRRCVEVCAEGPGRFVWSPGEEGSGPVECGAADLRHSDCVACGECVDWCPTAALSDRDREGAGAAPERVVRSTCGYCGVGCQVEVCVAGDRVQRIDGVREAAVNRGRLCLKGRYAHAWRASRDRLTQPLIRTGGDLEPASWEEAIARVAEGLDRIHRQHGPDALGTFTSSRSTNEAEYLLQKLFQVRFGTNHVDCCARVCHSSTALALRWATGAGAASASYDDIERARCIAVVGANPTEAHPVVGARILQAARAGVPLIVIDPRRIELADLAQLHLALRPGTNVELFHSLAQRLVQRGEVDREYLERRCEGWPELEALLAGMDGLGAAARCGVGEADLDRAAALLGGGPVLFVHGLGLSELTQGTDSVRALCNLGMLTGSIGRVGAGMLPLRGQNNVQGNADMGSLPGFLPGYQPVTDPEVRARLERLWGVPPPERPGLTIPEMLEAAKAGDMRALWIQGEDVAQSDPGESQVLAALEALELLVVQELFLTETGRRAHVVLPAAGWLEQDGTFTNGERRIQRVRPALDPPGQARPDWEVVCDVARALGLPWSYASPAEVMDEIARVAPHLFGGVSYRRLEQADGLQWPCRSPDHPGTATLHARGFLRGHGRLAAIAPLVAPEADVPGYPLTLVTGRVLQHYNVGTMTRRTPNLELAARDWLSLHPEELGRRGLRDGDAVAIESRWGRTQAQVRSSHRVPPGLAFLSFHHPETHTNRLIGPHRDPESQCPDYKVTAVRVAPLGPAGDGPS